MARAAAALLTCLVVVACGDAGPELAFVIDPPASTELTVGDVVTLMASGVGAGITPTWSSSDITVARVAAGRVEALRPGATTISVSAPGVTPGTMGLTVVARPNGYTADEVDYFGEIAFGAEFGGAAPLLHRWRSGSGPLIRLHGSPTSTDRVVLDSVMAEINRLAPVDMQIVTDFPTVDMHFVPQSQFQDVFADAPPGNNGLVWIWWDAEQYVVRGIVLISTTMTQTVRTHVIREEITQLLGLLRDSFDYPQSIFYQAFSDVDEYLPIDRVVIELLHRPELPVGVDKDEGLRIARTLTRGMAAPGATEGPASARGTAAMEGAAAPPRSGRPGSAGSGG